MPGQPKFTRSVSVSVDVSPLEPTVKDWNRGFELGDLSEWTPVDAEISEVDPYAGDYCCLLEDTDSEITQDLDDPMPVNAVFEFSAWLKRVAGAAAFVLQMNHTDGTTNQVGGALISDGWKRFWFDRASMRADKILSGITILSEDGDFYVDSIRLGLATEVVTGAVDVSQGVPRALQAEAIARPKGFEMDGFPKKGSVTTTATYATVVEYTVPDGYKYELTKILISCPEDVMYKIRWDGTDKSAEVYVTGGIPFTDWFPWGYIKMWGDDVKKIDIQVKYPSGGAAATCHAELVGEYVLDTFNDPG